MALELDTSTIGARKLSDLERQLYSEADVSPEKESFLHEAGGVAKYVLDLYFKPKSFEKSGGVYKALGVRLFKKIVFNGDYTNRLIRKLSPNHKFVKGENSARVWEMFTRIYEGIHVLGFSVMTPLMISNLADGNYKSAAINAGVNIVVNIYPIMLQRYNRARIYNVLDRAQEKTPTR